MSDIIKTWWPFTAAAVGFIVAAVVVVKYKIPWIQIRLKKLEKFSHKQEVTRMDMTDVVRKDEIYYKGQPIYQLHTGCKGVQTSICKKVDELKDTIKDLSKANVESKEKLTKVMTRVEDFMMLDRTKELETFANIMVKKIKE